VPAFERLIVPPHQIGQRLAGYVGFSSISRTYSGINVANGRQRRLTGQNVLILGVGWEDGVERFLVRRKPAVGTRSRDDDLRNSH